MAPVVMELVVMEPVVMGQRGGMDCCVESSRKRREREMEGVGGEAEEKEGAATDGAGATHSLMLCYAGRGRRLISTRVRILLHIITVCPRAGVGGGGGGDIGDCRATASYRVVWYGTWPGQSNPIDSSAARYRVIVCTAPPPSVSVKHQHRNSSNVVTDRPTISHHAADRPCPISLSVR